MSGSQKAVRALTALLAVVLVAGLGFAGGYLAKDRLNPPSPVRETVVVEITSKPAPAEPTLAPTAVAPTEPSPTEVPPTEAPPPTEPPTPAVEGQDLDLFWEVWRLIERDYYGELPPKEEIINGAIRGALNTLDDPFTGFIEPRAAAINREDDSGAFEGIGAYVAMEDGLLRIVSTFKDQPAEKAGLRRDDIVLQVDDTKIENMSIYEAITLIRGPADTAVRLTVAREGVGPFEVTITRAKIEIPVVEWAMRDDGLGYVSLADFSTDASVKLHDALNEITSRGATGLILDLRGNPGGWLNEAVLVTGLFLPKNDVVLIERFKDGDSREYRTETDPVLTDLPMVVLVDGGSASASEIVAGALQDSGRAMLIGETTFGKGSVQWPQELSNGAEVRVTVARWFTPNDRAIHGEGLEPDIAVEYTQADADADADPQLDRAAEYLLTGK